MREAGQQPAMSSDVVTYRGGKARQGQERQLQVAENCMQARSSSAVSVIQGAAAGQGAGQGKGRARGR